MISAIVLAAGTSARMGRANKLLLPFKGMPLVARAVRAVCASAATEAVVVAGCDKLRVQAALIHLPVRMVANDHYAAGLTSSIQVGLRTASPEAQGFMLCMADTPLVTATDIDALIGTFERALQNDPRAIVRATCQKRPGHPVIFASAYRAPILAHEDPTGCRALVRRHRAHTTSVEMAGSTTDIDTDSDYALLLGRQPEMP